MKSSLKKAFFVVVLFLLGMWVGTLISRAEAQNIQTYADGQLAQPTCNWPTDPGYRGTQLGALLKSAGKDCHETREHHIAALQHNLTGLRQSYREVAGTHATYRSDELGWQVMQIRMRNQIAELELAIRDARTSTWASTPQEAEAARVASQQRAQADAHAKLVDQAAARVNDALDECRRDYPSCDKEGVDRLTQAWDALEPENGAQHRQIVGEAYARIEAGIARSNSRAEERRQRKACETAKENLSGLPIVGMIVSRTKKC